MVLHLKHKFFESLIEAEATAGFNSPFFAALTADKDLGATRGIDAALKAHNLDALVLPATGFTTVPAGESTLPLVPCGACS